MPHAHAEQRPRARRAFSWTNLLLRVLGEQSSLVLPSLRSSCHEQPRSYPQTPTRSNRLLLLFSVLRDALRWGTVLVLQRDLELEVEVEVEP